MKTTVLSFLLTTLLIPAGCGLPSAPAGAPAAASAQALTPKALDILKSALDEGNAFLRTAAVEIAAETGQKQWIPTLVTRTDDPVVTVRFAAVVALGDLRCGTCRPALREKLNDDNPNVRMAAAYALTQIGDGSRHESIRSYIDSGDPTIAANAVLLLGKLGSRDDLPRFYELLGNNDAPDKVRFQALESIARLGDTKVYRTKIWPLLISKYHDDRVWGIRCMGLLGTPEAKTAIQTMLEDDVIEVRLTAAEQLGRLKDRSGTQLVKDYLDKANLDETTMANQTAVAAIGTIGSDSLRGYLHPALTGRSPLIRLFAAQAVLMSNQ